MLRRLVIVFVLLLLIVSSKPIVAQSINVRFEHLTVEDGLSEGVVHCILQDKQGFIWFGTQQGLNRYDGYEIKVFVHHPFDSTSLNSDVIQCLYEDTRGRLWVGTELGLSLFIPETESFVNYSLDSVGGIQYPVTAICEHDGFLWAATINGLRKITVKESSSAIPIFSKVESFYSKIIYSWILSLLPDSSGSMFIGTSIGLAKSQSGENSLTPIVSGIKEVLCIVRDSSNSIWFGSYQGLMSYNPGNNAIQNYRISNSPTSSENIVKSLLFDSRGTLWIGTFDGLVKFDTATKSFVRFRHDARDVQSLSNNRIYSLTEDKSGVLWIGTFGGGINKANLYTKRFNTFRHVENDNKTIIDNMVMRLHEDKSGLLWVATWDKGITALDRENGVTRHLTGGDSVFKGIVFNEDSLGNLWVSNHLGVFVHDKVKSELKRRNSNLRTITSMITDHQGTIWFGQPNQLCSYNVASETVVSFVDKQRPLSESPKQIAEDAEGNIWFIAGGLFKLERRTGKITSYLHDPNNTASLSSSMTSSLLLSEKNEIWVTTLGGGLNKFNPSTQTFTHFTEADGLANNYVYGVLEDENGNLWMSTNKGISRFNPETNTFRNYSVEDGLQGNEFNRGAFFKSKSGEMFFGGVNGFNSFYPNQIKDNSNIPEIVLTGFQLFNKDIRLEKSILLVDEITLDYDQNYFSFEFAALDFVNPQNNSFKYILEGFDSYWTDAGTVRAAHYTDVHPGEYTFRVTGSNNDGVWNQRGTAIRIFVLPPFWATWWFRTVVGLILFASVVWTSRAISVRRMKVKMKELEHQHVLEKERFRISKDMHDELGSQLTQIGLMSGLAKRDKTNPEKIERTLEDISQTTLEIVSSFDEIVWAVNPRYDTLEGMIDYLAQYASSFLERAGIDLRTELPSIQEQIHVSAEIRHNIFMIVKETLTNVIKYADATEVRFFPKIEGQIFSLLIQDNGRGFDVASVKQFSEGLNNMKLRMVEIGGEFTLTSAPSNGASITITVKLT